MRVLIAILWIWALLGSLAGCGILVYGLTEGAESAPQEAVFAAVAIALAVLPYCFARGVSALKGNNDTMREEE